MLTHTLKILKQMMSQPGKQTTAMHILPNILRNIIIQWNLIEYYARNIFLEKSKTKYGGFLKKSELSVSLD